MYIDPYFKFVIKFVLTQSIALGSVYVYIELHPVWNSSKTGFGGSWIRKNVIEPESTWLQLVPGEPSHKF
jgi:hypothetical protein